jgi:hypothetical protein
MTLKDLWVLYEADKRILGFSTHTNESRLSTTKDSGS